MSLDKYEGLASLIVDHPEILFNLKWNAVSSKRINSVIAFAVNNLIYTNTDLMLVATVLQHELKVRGADTFLRANSFSNKFLGYWIKSCGQEYLISEIGPLVKEVVSLEVSFEVQVDPEKEPKKSKKKPGNDKTKAKVVAQCEKFIQTIVNSVEKVPPRIRLAAFLVSTFCQDLDIPRSTAIVYIGAFIMLKFINPAIVAPELYDLITEAPSHVSRRNLITITKVLQSVTNGTNFEGQIDLTDFVAKHKGSMSLFLEAIPERKSRLNPLSGTTELKERQKLVYKDLPAMLALHLQLYSQLEEIKTYDHCASLSTFEGISNVLKAKLSTVLDILGQPVPFESTTQLYEAAKADDIFRFVKIASNPDTDVTAVIESDPLWNPLQWVLEKSERAATGATVLPSNLKQLCSVLLEKGVYTAYSDPKGYTALHALSRLRWDRDAAVHKKIFQTFQDQGADFNVQSESGESPLHLAVFDGVYESVEHLLSCGADPNLLTTRGDSPLHYVFHRSASQNSHTNTLILHRLLKNGANPLLRGTYNKNCQELINSLPSYTKRREYQELYDGFITAESLAEQAEKRIFHSNILVIQKALEETLRELPELRNTSRWKDIVDKLEECKSLTEPAEEEKKEKEKEKEPKTKPSRNNRPRSRSMEELSSSPGAQEKAPINLKLRKSKSPFKFRSKSARKAPAEV